MPKKPGALDRIREICLALPDTKETLTWGEPHFRVGDKIFAGFGQENGRAVIGFKLTKPHAHAITEDPRFWPAPYVGQHGWVSMDATGVQDWERVREFVHISYRLIAPKKLAALLDAGGKLPARKAAARGTNPARERSPRNVARAAKPAVRPAAARRADRHQSK